MPACSSSCPRPDGRWSPVLLGATPGDDSVAGIGTRPMTRCARTRRPRRPAASWPRPGRNASHEDVVWVDYANAVSMHRVRLVDPKERRLERLASPDPAERRISYGCINVPVAFFERSSGRCSARPGRSSTSCPKSAPSTRSSPPRTSAERPRRQPKSHRRSASVTISRRSRANPESARRRPRDNSAAASRIRGSSAGGFLPAIPRR